MHRHLQQVSHYHAQYAHRRHYETASGLKLHVSLLYLSIVRQRAVARSRSLNKGNNKLRSARGSVK